MQQNEETIEQVKKGTYFANDENLVQKLIIEGVQIDGQHPVAWLEKEKGLIDGESRTAVWYAERKMANQAVLYTESSEVEEVRPAYETISNLAEKTRRPEFGVNDKRGNRMVRVAIEKALALATARLAYADKASVPEARLQRLEAEYQNALKNAQKEVKGISYLRNMLKDLAVAMISVRKWGQFSEKGGVLPSWTSKKKLGELEQAGKTLKPTAPST